MFLGNSRRPLHSHSPNASEASVNQVIQNAWPVRPMGPPQLNNPPQPVEIDPVSYPRISGPYTPWEGNTYSSGCIGEPNPPIHNSVGHNKSSPMPLDFGVRSIPQDQLAGWFNGNDAPWIPKGAVPEVSQDERIHSRGYSYRNPGYGSPPGTRHRPGNPSDNGSVHFGISPSDSGYGTGISLESASVRGSDIVDHIRDNRNGLGRVPEMLQYPERRPTRDSHGTEQWPYNSPSTMYHCQTCRRQVKTKSELKKHHLRHTKPYRCTNSSCNRTEGFSTVNDLNRHKQSKHRDDLPGEMHLKAYHCLVPGCKSQDKIWPRLDNFKSHLKRMHHLQEERMDQYAQRGERDQRTNVSPPSQGTSSASPPRLDQDIQLGLGSDNFPEISYPSDQPQWNNVSSSPLDRQIETTGSLLDNIDTQTLMSPNEESTISLEDGPSRLIGLRGSRTLLESDAENGCQVEKGEIVSADATSQSKSGPMMESLGSSVRTLQSADTVVRGKTPKPKKAPQMDPCLRDAIITAVFSTANPGKVDGSYPELKSPPGIGSPDMVHVSEISRCRMDSRIALPDQAVTSGNHPDDEDPCLKASSTSATDKTDLTDQEAKIQKLLQVIKDAGYVIKKENKSQTGLGQSVNNLASGAHKKRDPVGCSHCRFHGRPCELKKHMKRHTRPYGCTFPKCLKTFGSKNDWKRHESSQHFQHETWRCDEKTNGASCTKVFISADNARAHLAKMHKIIDPDVIERKIDTRRMGADNQGRYWCGFCEGIIDLTLKGTDAWTERFNHIDDHFMGKNGQTKQSISQWKAADSDGERLQQHSSAQSQSPNGGDEASDGSSPSSSGTSSTTSPENPTTQRSPNIVPAQQKRKRADTDDRDGRSKQPRHGKYELRIECCQCGIYLNPRTDTACPCDGHDLCSGCPRRKMLVPKDDA